MIPTQNILYIGPYREESSRGFYSYMNIKALEKAGHKLKIIPLFLYGKLNNKFSQDIEHLEENNLDKYDVCIQHCETLDYAYNSYFKKNIGIYDFGNFDPNPMVNSNVILLDKIVVSSENKKTILQNVLSQQLHQNIIVSPQLININHIRYKEKKELDWPDKNRFYFYSELDFSEQYDWEKLIYIYLTSFMNKNTGLIIQTKDLEEEKIKLLKNQIYSMATAAKVKPVSSAMPQVLNGVYDEENLLTIHNSVDCLIDVNKSNEPSYSALCFAINDKPIICNKYLTTADYFSKAYRVDGMICNSSMIYNNDIMNSSMNNYYYTLDGEQLKNAMLETYQNRYKTKNVDIYKQEINNHDISQINNILI
jgi:hypothetical protein